jgi:hypothetical protein
VDEILRLIKAFQFVEKYGEVCPANWQPGDATIDPAKSKDYFKAANDGASSSEAIAEESVVLDVSDKAAFTTLIGESTLIVVYIYISLWDNIWLSFDLFVLNLIPCQSNALYT